jgi:hypothetical protein
MVTRRDFFACRRNNPDFGFPCAMDPGHSSINASNEVRLRNVEPDDLAIFY